MEWRLTILSVMDQIWWHWWWWWRWQSVTIQHVFEFFDWNVRNGLLTQFLQLFWLDLMVLSTNRWFYFYFDSQRCACVLSVAYISYCCLWECSTQFNCTLYTYRNYFHPFVSAWLDSSAKLHTCYSRSNKKGAHTYDDDDQYS